jgi:F-type H+-transporting ATPase subunit a
MHILPVKAEELFRIGFLPVTNSLLTSWLSVSLLLISAIIVGMNYKKLPSGLQHVFEMVYEMFANMAQEAMGKTGLKFVPLVVTYFLFIIISNWIGILPGVGSILVADAQGHKVPLFRGGNADLNTTFALAIIAQVVVHVNGIRSAGLKHYLGHFKNPLEIVTEFAKILSFSFRLFGNVFAGEVMLSTMANILGVVTRTTQTWFAIPGGIIMIPFFILELFVGFIQAFVFALLVNSFLSLFVKTEEHSHGH